MVKFLSGTFLPDFISCKFSQEFINGTNVPKWFQKIIPFLNSCKIGHKVSQVRHLSRFHKKDRYYKWDIFPKFRQWNNFQIFISRTFFQDIISGTFFQDFISGTFLPDFISDTSSQEFINGTNVPEKVSENYSIFEVL